jgi:hypothetical protein
MISRHETPPDLGIYATLDAAGGGSVWGGQPWSEKAPQSELHAGAAKILAESDAIVDAVVIRVNGYRGTVEVPAILRVKRVLKGPKFKVIEIYQESTACDLVFEGKAMTVRAVLRSRKLENGSRRWYVPGDLNDRWYAGSLDQLLGVTRPEGGWPD